jgi:hypothetical protein
MTQGQVWWSVPVIPALGRPGKEDLEFQVSLGYTVRPCLKEKNKTKQSGAVAHAPGKIPRFYVKIN